MKASVWRSHPRRVPLFTVTMMAMKKKIYREFIYRISRKSVGGGVNITMIFMVTSSHFMGPYR